MSAGSTNLGTRRGTKREMAPDFVLRFRAVQDGEDVQKKPMSESGTSMMDRDRDETLRGVVFDIQRMSIHDGPGIRTTVFLKGCPLECFWCHNPEGRSTRRQLAFTPALCIGCGFCFTHCPNDVHVVVDGAHTMERERCTECFACVEECYSNALEVIGREQSVAEVLAEVEKDRPFYDESNGGMTLSGGEPLAQFPFAEGLLAGARARGLHTCVETSGFVRQEHLKALIPLVDLFLYDYKETDPERHREYTGQSNEQIIENLRMLDEHGAALILRCPIVPEVNLRDDHLQGIVDLAGSLRRCQGINIMGYHCLGESKRSRLGIAGSEGEGARFRDMSRAEIEAVVARVAELGGANVSSG
ncbi:MAG: glycyl-radical enzyme activating protein [Candidatus Hydrogenedentes bacterium]|nr:glycyl-radical enzyme activating protein [Candidatus Hydrogenedentota bacterium]